jgi:hypothetical protein
MAERLCEEPPFYLHFRGGGAAGFVWLVKPKVNLCEGAPACGMLDPIKMMPVTPINVRQGLLDPGITRFAIMLWSF